ncbi:MAG: UDP-glucose--hexose-1-phosphate uridylyltransferase [Candidatus Aegiribacteria sp.]|nr:UDP-glucose--hexose-1-phosphate uridylyltransferase [Candidatus Aegiribacteria sp.]
MNYEKPHRRLNPLTGRWVLVSPDRSTRPWHGSVETTDKSVPLPEFDPDCHLCPGNLRAGGERNPSYEGVFVFDNDFPALMRSGDVSFERTQPWKQGMMETGICRVICYSPLHNISSADLDNATLLAVFDTWMDQIDELMSVPDLNYVQIFENRGIMMGCSNPHPHGQIWATGSVPCEVESEDFHQAKYLQENGECLLCDVQRHELASGERIVLENDHLAVIVPWWAEWPFETMLFPKYHSASLTDLDSEQKDSLAVIWKRLLLTYDNLFNTSMPFSSGWHMVPANPRAAESWHLHAHFYPPLLRSAAVRKFMVGYEMLAEPQRDITPEEAAERLRLSTV